MRRQPAFFDGKEPTLVYIAKRLREALKLEALFTEASIDYGVEADEYKGGLIFPRVRAGAFFYVLPETADAARQFLREHGYRPTNLEEQD